MAVKELDEKKLQEIIADLKSGMKVMDIRKKHGIGWKRFRKIQKEYDLYRRHGRTRTIIDEEAQFYDQWCKDWEIARKRILEGK